jgi:flagellar protein FlaF
MGYEVYAGLQQASESARDLEIRAISHVTRQLADVNQPEADPLERIRALNGNLKLWSLLTQDLESPGNGLPDEIKANYISIGRFAYRTSLASLQSKEPLDTLIAINTDVLDALHQQREAA